MIARPRPILHMLDEAVFDRVVMDVVDVPLQIGLIANLVLPEPALPKPALAFPIS